MLVSCSNDQTIKVWNIASGACLSTMTGHSRLTGVAFSADGQWLTTGSVDGMMGMGNGSQPAASTIRLWDARPGATVVSPV
jgi:WD40 repeat protein